MTSKEKAKNFIRIFNYIINKDKQNHNQVKICAIECVCQIVSSIKYREGEDSDFIGFEYWENVKKEIKKIKSNELEF